VRRRPESRPKNEVF